MPVLRRAIRTAHMGVTELSRELGMTKSTVHKLLLTLEYKKLVEQDVETSKYGLSLSFVLMLQTFLSEEKLTAKIRPQMERLVAQFNETMHFGVYMDGALIIAAKQEARQSVRVTSQVGRISNLYCTSMGKAILANLPEGERDALLLGYDYPRYTKHTITDPHEFLHELERIRALGYSIDNEEYEEGIRCVSVPVFGLYRNLCGAVSMKLLPAPTNTPDDAGPYITLGICKATHPDTGVSDVTIHRLCLQGPDSLSIYFAPGSRHIGAMATAQALGYDVFGIIARWTEETFHFSVSASSETSATPSGDAAYKDLQAALDAYGVAGTVAPTWRRLSPRTAGTPYGTISPQPSPLWAASAICWSASPPCSWAACACA